MTQPELQQSPTKSDKLAIQEQIVQINAEIKQSLVGNDIFHTFDRLQSVETKVNELLSIFHTLNTNFTSNLQVGDMILDFKSNIQEIETMDKEISKLKVVEEYLSLFSMLEAEQSVVRKATLLKELERINVPAPIYPIMEREHAQFHTMKQEIVKQSMLNLEQALQQNDSNLLQQSVQILVNLDILQSSIKEILAEYESKIRIESLKQFDAKIINEMIQELKLTGKEMILNWAQILWNRIEELLEFVYATSLKVNNFNSFLMKHNYIQQGIVKEYFERLANDLLSVMESSSKKYPNLHQMLYAGYPKLLRKFLDLFQKLSLIIDIVDFQEQLKHGLSKFQNLYLGRVGARLLEACRVESGDCNKVIKSVQQELNAVQFDILLSEKVVNLVQRTCIQYRTSSMNNLKMNAPFRIASTHPGVLQQAKLNVINYFAIMADELYELSDEFAANHLVTEILFQESLNYTKDISSVLQQVLLDMYNDLVPTISKLGEPKQVGELVGKSRWVFRQVLCKLQISNITSIAQQFVDRILNTTILSLACIDFIEGSLKSLILQGLQEIEYAFSQSLLLLGAKEDIAIFEPLHEFKYIHIYKGHYWNLPCLK